MDEAELEARLVLSQVSADTGEQIEITRDVNGVEVQGLVESEGRKQVLKTSLQGIPFLSLRIRSFDDLESLPGPGAQVAPAQQYTAVKQVSPLEQYFAQQGRSRDDLTRISAGLFNSSLAISRSSRFIKQLLLRFSANEGLSPVAIHARDELLRRNVARLLQDLKEQQDLLEETGIAFESQTGVPGNADSDSRDFVRLAERNRSAIRELISLPGGSGHSEKQMAAELAETISDLRSAALALGPEEPQ
jgi:hypothetical protein